MRTAFLKRRAETGLRIYLLIRAVQDIQPIAFIIPNITSVRSACTAPDKLAGHILIFHYLLRCHPTGRHPRCHFGAFTAHLGCRCCPGEQPGQPRRFLGGDDCQPVISCTAPSVFRDNHGLLGEPSIPSRIAGCRPGTSTEEQRKPKRRV